MFVFKVITSCAITTAKYVSSYKVSRDKNAIYKLEKEILNKFDIDDNDDDDND